MQPLPLLKSRLLQSAMRWRPGAPACRSRRRLNRVGSAARIGLDRAQVVEGLPSLRLAAGRLIEFAHDANRRLLDRANLWQPSSASSALR
jgi:hypothetical protein